MMIRRLSLGHCGLVIVGGLNFWLLAMIVSDLRSVGGITVGKVEWKPNLTPSMERTGNKKTIDNYKQILARPIFYKTREPFVPPPPTLSVAKAAVPAIVADPGFVLGGVTITSEIKKAYIYTKTNNSGTWTSEGDNLMGWKVRSVERGSVRLEQEERVIEVWLYPQTSNAQH
jgi:hypothetical protein